MTGKIKASKHCAERFMQRVMGLGEDVIYTEDHIKAAKEKVEALFISKFGTLPNFPDGDYRFDEWCFVVKNQTLLTVKQIKQKFNDSLS